MYYNLHLVVDASFGISCQRLGAWPTQMTVRLCKRIKKDGACDQGWPRKTSLQNKSSQLTRLAANVFSNTALCLTHPVCAVRVVCIEGINLEQVNLFSNSCQERAHYNLVLWRRRGVVSYAATFKPGSRQARGYHFSKRLSNEPSSMSLNCRRNFMQVQKKKKLLIFFVKVCVKTQKKM